VKRIATFVLLALVVLGAPAGFLAAQPVSLTILHTNDTHGHLRPFSYPTMVPPGSELSGLAVRTDIGGIARRATLARQIEEALKAQGTPVWLVDAGDFMDGTSFSLEYKGEADVAAMNAAGYDFGTLGNHEFNNTVAQVRKLVEMATFPTLCANVVDTARERPLTGPYRIERIGDVRVGVFGLVTREAAGYPAGKSGLSILDEAETARKVVADLRRQADIVMLISHAGEGMDRELAAKVPGIDVIVGGHSHSRLPNGVFIWHSDDLAPNRVNGTIIVQAHQWGGELGRLDLLFDRDAAGRWHVTRYRARLIPVTAQYDADPAVAAVVDKYWKPLAPKYGEIIGTAVGDFISRGDDRAEYNLVADAVRETFGAEIGLENNGGIRAPLVSGTITREDLVTMDPFDNTVVSFTLTGRELVRILASHTPAVSGVRYRVEKGEVAEVTIGGKPLDPGRRYTAVTNSYFAQFALKGIPFSDTGKSRLGTLTEYIRRRGTVRPLYDGRRVIVGRGGQN